MTRRIAALASALAAAAVLAACGSNSPAPSPSPSPTAAPTLPPGSDTYPQHDTPIDQAPPALAATWKPYGVDLIPGHDTVDPSAKWPQAIDGTGGQLSPQQVDAVAAAVMRVQVLAAWGDEHDQMPLEAHMMNTTFLLGPIGVAVAEGTRIHTPDCSTYPEALVVHSPAPDVRDALVKSGQNIGSDAIPVAMAFAGPCTITGTTRKGDEVTIDNEPAAIIVAMVTLRDDPVLGPIAHLDGAAACPSPAVASLCPSGNG